MNQVDYEQKNEEETPKLQTPKTNPQTPKQTPKLNPQTTPPNPQTNRKPLNKPPKPLKNQTPTGCSVSTSLFNREGNGK